VLSGAKEGDFVWVHDYQLMLLPAMLREAMPSLKIGFFLHTPFPSFEVFRCHPNRRELVSGLLGADLVGFHTFGYVRHFRSSVLRLLGLEAEMMRIRHDGRETWLGVYPIGINAGKITQELGTPEFQQQLSKTAAAHEGIQIVMSVERLDYTKGVVHRLDAIDLFLSKLPAEKRDRVKFIMISVPSRENVDEYRELREEVEWKVGRINGKYATLSDSPIRFIHGSVNFHELCALYAIADVGLVTPLIDGMNLVAKEYVACQRPREAGVLVLSEFAGAAEELFNAIIVNPYDTEALAKAIEDGLRMPAQERSQRMLPMRQRVLESDATAWAQAFIGDLRRRCGHESGASSSTAPLGNNLNEAQQQIRQAIQSRRRMAMFLDYDGTLREIVRDPAEAAPTPALRALLNRLRTVESLDVTIISGRTAEDLEAFVGDYPVGLIAEHGAAMRRPDSRQWEQLDRNTDYSWKEELTRVLRLYERSTPGSFVEVKRTSLVWHYRRSDPEFGEWKAKHLTEELALLTANEPLHIRHGKMIVEISPTEINKGAAVLRIVQSASPEYDLIIVAGDDQTDQSMYRLILQKMISINVGDAALDAQYNLPNPGALQKFLNDAVAPVASRASRS
nr:bifunctional alpha,alpha-trehalose-phosphate synthase (UDP-forming)/trehalose-phosphatase [Gemmatimonadaceae bacterium]